MFGNELACGMPSAECPAVCEQPFLRGGVRQTGRRWGRHASLYHWTVRNEGALPGRPGNQVTGTDQLRRGNAEDVDSASVRGAAMAGCRTGLDRRTEIHDHG